MMRTLQDDPRQPSVNAWQAAVLGPADDPRDPGESEAEEAPAQGHRSRQLALRLRLTVFDIATLMIAWIPPAVTNSMSSSWDRRLSSAIAAMATTLVAMRLTGMYRSRVCERQPSAIGRTVLASVLGGAVFSACVWSPSFTLTSTVVEGTAASSLLLLLVRWHFARWMKQQRSKGLDRRRVVMAGTNQDSLTLFNMLTDEPELGFEIAAVIGDSPPDCPWADRPVYADSTELAEIARTTDAVGVIVVASAMNPTVRSDTVKRALDAGLHVQVWLGLEGLSSRRTHVTSTSSLPMLYVDAHGITTWQRAVKRALDIVIAAVMCPVVAPVLALAALAIKLEDRGPVIHRHKVIGRHGAPITVLKLRTMVQGAEGMLPQLSSLNERRGGPLFKASYDPRVTRIGRMLRATSVDELPQLWNVLNGTMSLVGPRFALPSEVAHFDNELKRRHEMRPGITGLWQSEARDNPSFSAYRRLDLYYVDNWSIALDLAILINTAYGVTSHALHGITSRVHNTGKTSLVVPDGTTLANSELSRTELATTE